MAPGPRRAAPTEVEAASEVAFERTRNSAWGCALSRNWGRLPVRLMRPGHVRLGTELRVGSFGPVTGGLRVGRQARCPPSILPSLARFRFEDWTRRGLLSLMDQGASKCQLGVHSLPAYLTVLIHVWLEKLDSDHIQMAPSGLPQ